ncbi:Tripartite motif-containing protein 39 [Chelonia mydas]|uniref:Tripartite motif-containing protein 39 n=1 Tax=Chelonia mydas TaxID=8469 RepID=M7CJJ7_CHEMY|nr:Tripartite motif-containing protein 39 [Chelonia mydas]
MAKSNLVQELQLAVTCPICTQSMEVPVTLDCGHNYCQACILRYWDRAEEEEEDPKQAPQCRWSFRQRSFRPNKLLAKVMAMAKRFPSQDEAQDVHSRSSTLGGVEPMGQQHLLHFLHDGQQMILQKLQEMERGNGTREEGEVRKEEPDPEQQDENNTLSRLVLQLYQKMNDCLVISFTKAEMTLDLKTAYPELVISRDRRSVRLGDERHKVPNYYERFDTNPCVLASEGFSFGRYSWEVEVGDAGCWAVGVARKSVKRKGHLTFTPEHGFWTVEMHMGKYWALSNSPSRVFCKDRLRRVGICLDYVAGQVHFRNAETLAHLYTFTTSFMEEIFPFFYTEDKQTPLVIKKFEIE